MSTVFGPILQDEAYHLFADQRSWLGVPNFLNVVSNLPFLLAGIIGLRKAPSIEWRVVFTGIAAVAIGSSYYHLAPDTRRLFWDRLPMTIAFMAVFAIVLGETVDKRIVRHGLWPLVAAGLGGAVWWRMSGDLRLYVLVQFVPMLAIPVLLLWRNGPREWWGVLVLYTIAKLFEMWDRPVFDAGAVVSGHTLKHLFAAAACFWVLRAMRPRRTAMLS